MYKYLRPFLWYLAVLVAVTGVVSVGAGYPRYGWPLVGGAGGALAVAALVSAWRVTLSEAARPVGGVSMIVAGALALFASVVVASGALGASIPLSARVVSLAAGAQAFLLAIDLRVSAASHRERVVVPFIGHLTVLFGSVLVLETALFRPRAAILAYAVGFAALSIHAAWMRQRTTGVAPARPGNEPQYWEGVLITAVAVGVVGAVVAAVTAGPDAPATAPRVVTIGAGTLAGAAAAVVLATQAPTPAVPAALRALTGTVTTAAEHAVVTVVLLNVLLVSLLLVAPAAVTPLLGGYLALLTGSVLLEYLMLAHARRRRDRPDPAAFETAPPVTIVVSAANEGSILPETLERNLEAVPDVPVLVVPAAKSIDDTVAVAARYRDRYPDRVRVIEGTSGSKAGDLNAAWDHVETPFVLLLDADETVGPEFVSRGLKVLRERPAVGVVQGRKVARYPESDGLSRFVSADRQHSTWIEHPLMADLFGAAHFAGSAAIFRREVPPAVGGWDATRLTEDIDLTVRLYVDTDWRIAYDAQLIARELTPVTLAALIRQRVRWARGWAQVTAHHGPAVVRSWRSLGLRRTFGICWLLFTAISAPVYTVFPALLLAWALGLAADVPLAIAGGLAAILLPARAVSIAYATLRDPVVPLPPSRRRRVEMVFHAYLWIPVGWIIQLHALYLQLAGAPAVWHVTLKRAPAADPRHRHPAGPAVTRHGGRDDPDTEAGDVHGGFHESSR